MQSWPTHMKENLESDLERVPNGCVSRGIEDILGLVSPEAETETKLHGKAMY